MPDKASQRKPQASSDDPGIQTTVELADKMTRNHRMRAALLVALRRGEARDKKHAPQ